MGPSCRLKNSFQAFGIELFNICVYEPLNTNYNLYVKHPNVRIFSLNLKSGKFLGLIQRVSNLFIDQLDVGCFIYNLNFHAMIFEVCFLNLGCCPSSAIYASSLHEVIPNASPKILPLCPNKSNNSQRHSTTILVKCTVRPGTIYTPRQEKQNRICHAPSYILFLKQIGLFWLFVPTSKWGIWLELVQT